MTSDSNAIIFPAEGRFEEENKVVKCEVERVKSLRRTERKVHFTKSASIGVNND